MPRTDDEVVDVLLQIYAERYSGKTNQRFLIGWSGLRAIYGYHKLFNSRYQQLCQQAAEKGLYIFDLGQGNLERTVAVVKIRTVDRWRRVPQRIIEEYAAPSDGGEDGEEVMSEEDEG